jgi:hypothetical protein
VSEVGFGIDGHHFKWEREILLGMRRGLVCVISELWRV